LGSTLKQGEDSPMGLRESNDANMRMVEASRSFYWSISRNAFGVEATIVQYSIRNL
jgi:hypothetical protein